MNLHFDWDANKARANYRKHGVRFEEGVTVFEDPLSITVTDPDHSADEDRLIDIGLSSRDNFLWLSIRNEWRIFGSSVVDGRQTPKEKFMSNLKSSTPANEEMRPDYDFRGGVRGKHAKAMQAGYTITIRQDDGTTTVQTVEPRQGTVILEPDVLAYFPDSAAVNHALRTLITLFPDQPPVSKA